eukprot:PhM_4_TR9117/c0_g2_i1/m.30721/K10865/MRE11; double-strand break repair protein MRE11
MNVIKIMVTTDNHLGFRERDTVRGDDSFVTFEECFAIAHEQQADMALLGGDLFHDNKPSLKTMVRTVSMFRQNVLGGRAVEIDVVSDPRVNFPTHAVPCANFQDPNLNVSLPVFAIHGNHDDALSGVSSLDVLGCSGLINYFGHTDDVDQIDLHPVLIVKGSGAEATRIALYGLGHIRDERLHRCFTLGKVSLRLPVDEPDSWFRILVVHQNRGVRNPVGHSKAGLYDEMLAGMADLVIWGNEHEQRMLPQEVVPSSSSSGLRGFDIIQPGSTVATSLTSEECNPKQCCILEVHKRAYRITPYTLKSVRPTIQRTVELRRESGLPKRSDAVEEFLRATVETMVQESDDLVRAIPDAVLRKHPKLKRPLLRLNVEYSDVAGQAPFPIQHPARFGQHFVDVVANPEDILRTLKVKATRGGRTGHDDVIGGGGGVEGEDDGGAGAGMTTGDIRVRIQDLLADTSREVCTMLSEPALTTAVFNFAERDERGAIEDAVGALLESCQKKIWRNVRDDIGPGKLVDMDVSKVVTQAKEFKATMNRELRAHSVVEQQQPQQHHDAPPQPETSHGDDEGMPEGFGGDVLPAPPPPPPPPAAPKSRAKKSAVAKKSSPQDSAVVVLDDDDDGGDDDHDEGAIIKKKTAPAKRSSKKAPAAVSKRGRDSPTERSAKKQVTTTKDAHNITLKWKSEPQDDD